MDNERTPLITPEQAYPESDVDAQGDQKPKAFKDLIFLVWPLAIGEFLVAIDATIVVSAYASIGTDLNALQSTSWIATAYMLTATSFQPLYGKLSDIFGAKQCLLFSYAAFGIATWFCGLARNMTEMIIARAIAGIGGAGVMPVVVVIISDLVPLRSRGTWQGFINIIFSLGQAAGSPLGGFLSDTVGWRWAFYFQVPLAALAFVSVFFVLPDMKKNRPLVQNQTSLLSKIKRIDFLGSGTLMCSVFFLLLGLELGTNGLKFTTTLVISLLIGAILAMLGFLLVETKVAPEPLAPAHILSNPALLIAYLCNFFSFATWMATIFNISLYYQVVEKLTAGQAGLGLLPGVVAGVIGSLIAGVVMQMTGKYYWLTVLTYSVMVVGNLVICATTGLITHSLLGNYIGLALSCFGLGSGVTTTLIALIASSSMDDQAVVIAVSYLFRSLGMVLGVSISTALVQSFLRSSLEARLPADATNISDLVRRIRESLDYVDQLDPNTQAIVRSSYEKALLIAFIFTAILSFLTVFCSVFLKEKPIDRR